VEGGGGKAKALNRGRCRRDERKSSDGCDCGRHRHQPPERWTGSGMADALFGSRDGAAPRGLVRLAVGTWMSWALPVGEGGVGCFPHLVARGGNGGLTEALKAIIGARARGPGAIATAGPGGVPRRTEIRVRPRVPCGVRCRCGMRQTIGRIRWLTTMAIFGWYRLVLEVVVVFNTSKLTHKKLTP
jgi:hypothetical protein